MSKQLPRDIEAEITFLTTEDGGRIHDAADGFRPFFHYNGRNWITAHEYPDVEIAQLGEKVRAYIAFLSPLEQLDQLYVGMAFLIREGSKIVGYGSVTAILELGDSARSTSPKRGHDA